MRLFASVFSDRHAIVLLLDREMGGEREIEKMKRREMQTLWTPHGK